MRYCAVAGCVSSSLTPGVRLFCFPVSNELTIAWLNFCGNTALQERFRTSNHVPHSSSKICSLHFRLEDFQNSLRLKLLRNVVPSLNGPSLEYPRIHMSYNIDVGLAGRRLSAENAREEDIPSDDSSACEPTLEFTGTISTPPQPPKKKQHILPKNPNRYHMVEELPELYMSITLPYLEEKPLNLQWVYNILSGESEQERVVYESPCKDDKDGFVMIKDLEWDGINEERLHLIALPYRPGILSIRDLRETHLPLLRNVYRIGKKVIEEKYGVPGSQLRIYLQYLPSFYHLNIHFTSVNDETCDTQVGRAHLLHSVINILQECPNYYQVASLQFCLKESHKLFEKFKEHAAAGGLGSFS